MAGVADSVEARLLRGPDGGGVLLCVTADGCGGWPDSLSASCESRVGLGHQWCNVGGAR